jgi:hypothetical protein
VVELELGPIAIYSFSFQVLCANGMGLNLIFSSSKGLNVKM